MRTPNPSIARSMRCGSYNRRQTEERMQRRCTGPAICLAVALSALSSATVRTQSPQSSTSPTLSRLVDRFVLDPLTVAAGDLSPDGHWLAGTTISTRNRIGIDNTRFQDPTYIAPAPTDVWVIDTATGARRGVFSDKRQVRGLKWSPDSTRLALFVLNGAVFEPVLWDRASATTRPIAVPAGKEAADNADFEWSVDGSVVSFAVR